MKSENSSVKSELGKHTAGFKGQVFDNIFGGDSDQSFDQTTTRISIVVSSYHLDVTGALLEGALRTLSESGLPDKQIKVIWVPGAWEIPLAVKLTIDDNAHGVIALGVVIRGDTTHDQYINSTVSHQLGALATDMGRPVGFGLLTCNSLEQAIDRCGGKVGNKGCEAAEAVLAMIRLTQQIS